jgi:hypothetical protein
MPGFAQRACAGKTLSFRRMVAGGGLRASFQTGSDAQSFSWQTTLARGTTVAVALLFLVSSALATFPGQNGHIAYGMYNAGGTNASTTNIFLTDSGQLTQTTNAVSGGLTQYSFDSRPAWSADGNSVAFIRSLADVDSIEIIGKDGTGLRQVLNAAAIPAALPFVPFPEPQLFHISSLAWTPDGQRISFFVNNSTDVGTGIWTVNADGTGLTETVVGIASNGSPTLLSPLVNSSGYGTGIQLEWSSNNQMVFTCSFRSQTVGEAPPIDLCVLDGASGNIQQLPINFADGQSIPTTGAWPSLDWSPDGKKILFNAALLSSSGFQLYTINADGTGLAPVTTPDSCPTGYFSAHYSPDGQWIVAFTSGCAVLNPPVPVGENNEFYSLAVLTVQGAPASVLTTSPLLSIPDFSGQSYADWQPIPEALTVNFDDGESDQSVGKQPDPLKGIKVELRAVDDTVLDDKPINTVGGTYVFQNGASYIGTFLIRATLIDNTAPSGSQPAFDIRYADAPTGPVWIETKLTLTGQPITVSFSFSNAEPNLSSEGPALPADGVSRLADMAAIAFRVHQYVDWIRARLTPSAVPTVSYFTFATQDPDNGNPIDPMKGAYYNHADLPVTPKIVMDVAYSSYSDRDGNGNDDGPFVEWHEFNHHLYKNLINSRATCLFPYKVHAGYPNPDTCDSMDEGFAEFLPTLASRDILAPFFVVGVDGSLILTYNSSYGKLWNLAVPTFCWWQLGNYSNGDPIGAEEYAVAALFWDLVVRSGNTLPSGIITPSGAISDVTYTNSGPNIPISQLWAQLTSTNPATVWDIRKFFGNAPLTIDLDGDGVPDVAPIDIPFLMHGFYPIDTDQSSGIGKTNNTYFYDVGYAQRQGAFARDAYVGQSAHYSYNSAGAVTGTLIPRFDVPAVPNSNIGLTVLDSLGAPLSGATANLTINYPGGRTFISRQLDSTGLMYLELPPYFNYLLPQGAPLPACNPSTDLQVTVTLSVSAQGQTSTTTPSFNNCTYWQAVAAATTPAALSFTLTVPVIGSGGGDTIPPTTTLALSPRPNSAGWNNTNVNATLAATDNTGGSGVKQITYSGSGAQTFPITVVPGANTTVSISSEGQTTLDFFSLDNAGNSESTNQSVIMIDKTPPAINCGAADAQWHAADISIACAANDNLSGLASSANFTLATSVPPGTETANASTGSQSVCDVAGNCATAGPIGGNMIDKKAPTITLTTPANGATYSANQALSAAYACSDSGSGVAGCAGTVANGSKIDTTSNGVSTPKSFTITSVDKVGNTTSVVSNYLVSCHYVGIGISPSAVTPGSIITVSADVMSCTGSSQTVSVEFDLAGPRSPISCSSSRSVMFTTPPFTIPKGTSKAVSFPFRVPKNTCLGTYSVTSTTLIGGAAVDTTTATLTVQ